MSALATARIDWPEARRIIRSVHPPIDVFEDVADPEDWGALIALEQKSNPRLVEAIGQLDLVAPERRVGGPGASYLMAPFTHASPDRPTRFSAGHFGVLYCADRFETAIAETAHHHARFMSATGEAPGWTAQFRELSLAINAELSDLRDRPPAGVLDPESYDTAQLLGARLRAEGADGVVYPSVRDRQGECVGLFYPDCASAPVQGRHLDYHWNGTDVDLIRDCGTGQVFRIAA